MRRQPAGAALREVARPVAYIFFGPPACRPRQHARPRCLPHAAHVANFRTVARGRACAGSLHYTHACPCGAIELPPASNIPGCLLPGVNVLSHGAYCTPDIHATC